MNILIEQTEHKLAVLYADVSGSTRIYEEHGDKVARANIRTCLDILIDVATRHDGHLVKTIGDEIMCSFINPVMAAITAVEMQQSLQDASEQGEFSIGEMHVKIGWHYGPVNYRGKEIIGEAPVTAQQVIHLAKADEILTTGQSIHALPDELGENAHLIDAIEAEAWVGKLNVYTLPWEETEEVTHFEPARVRPEKTTVCDALMIEYHGRTMRLDENHAYFSIGRGQQNDLSVEGKFTSRLHAEIECRRGGFHLRDVSTNGTAVVYADGNTAHLHREELLINGEGSICFGGLPEEDPGGTVHFKCVRKKD